MSALVLALALPRSVVAQSDPLAAPALASERTALVALIEDLRRQDLPVDLVLDKVREGIAKRVPPFAITRAARVVAQHLRTAASMVGRRSPADRRIVLPALVAALESGIASQDLGRLQRELVGANVGALSQALSAATELHDRGFGGAAAVDAVREAFSAGGVGGFRRLLREIATGALQAGAGGDERLLGVAREASRERDRVDRGGGHGWGRTKNGGGGR